MSGTCSECPAIHRFLYLLLKISPNTFFSHKHATQWHLLASFTFLLSATEGRSVKTRSLKYKAVCLALIRVWRHEQLGRSRADLIQLMPTSSVFNFIMHSCFICVYSMQKKQTAASGRTTKLDVNHVSVCLTDTTSFGKLRMVPKGTNVYVYIVCCIHT